MLIPQRLFYALRMGRRHRRQLQQLSHGAFAAECVTTLVPTTLQAQGIHTLAVDFDGVLAAHGEACPLPATEAWLDACVHAFGADHVFILTNKPLPARLAYFAERYPGVRCIQGVAKKPYPEGLQTILHHNGCAADTLLMVDDRLLTGVLAACIAGTRAAYIRRPYVHFARRPVRESFFMLLRLGERWIFRGR